MAVAWLAAKPPTAADSPVRLDTTGRFLCVHYILPAPLAKAACPGTLKAVQLSDAGPVVTQSTPFVAFHEPSERRALVATHVDKNNGCPKMLA